MVLQVVLIIIFEELAFNHIILDLKKKISIFQNVIILIKSVVNKEKNEYYYNIFLEKGSYKDQSNTQYL